MKKILDDTKLMQLSNGEVTNGLTIDEDGTPLPGGLLDPTIFGSTRNTQYHDSDVHDTAEGVEIVERFGDTQDNNVGHVTLAASMVNPSSYEEIAKILHFDKEKVKQIAHYEYGVWLDVKAGENRFGTLFEIANNYDIKDYSEIMSGATALLYLLGEYDNISYDMVSSNLCVIPAQYRKCVLIRTETGVEPFDFNEINSCYLGVIENNNSLKKLLASPFHPTIFVWETSKNLQKSIDRLAEEVKDVNFIL